MAESIIIHFNQPDQASVLDRLQDRFGTSADGTRIFPAEDYLILVRSYEGFDSEYDESERDEVCAKLGGEPTASFDFEIRRSRSDDACDVLERFVRDGLQGMNFVVDDMWRLLSRCELEDTNDFLDRYRYKRQAEQVSASDGDKPSN